MLRDKKYKLAHDERGSSSACESLMCCGDVQPRRTITSPPAQNPESFSSLDILDNVLQLLFGEHVEGLPGLYRCELEGTEDTAPA